MYITKYFIAFYLEQQDFLETSTNYTLFLWSNQSIKPHLREMQKVTALDKLFNMRFS